MEKTKDRGWTALIGDNLRKHERFFHGDFAINVESMAVESNELGSDNNIACVKSGKEYCGRSRGHTDRVLAKSEFSTYQQFRLFGAEQLPEWNIANQQHFDRRVPENLGNKIRQQQ